MSESQHDIPISTKPSFLKRWLGWRILALSAVVLILLSPLLYRGWRLSQVPVTDEPFDVEAFQTEVPDDENAALLLLDAAEKLVVVAEADQEAYFKESYDGWDPGDAVLDRYLRANLPAMEIWRTAADRPDFQIDLDAADIETQMSFYGHVRDLNRFANSQIEKLVATGDPRAAIPWIEAMMRHAHLFRKNSAELNVLVGISFFAIASEATNDWAAHSDVDRTDLDRLLGMMIRARAINPPPSDTIKVAYLSNKKAYGGKSIDEYIKIYRDNGQEPPLGSWWRWWLEAEPQFTQRLMPHTTRNHLLFIDQDRRDRPPLVDGNLFDESSLGPAMRASLHPERLSSLLTQSHLLNLKNYLAKYLEALDKDEVRYRCLTVALAAQAYFRDHGEFPADAKELVPGYLDELPDDLYSPTPAPLIYRRDGHGAVVYSRFENEIDDGGTVVDYDERIANEDLPDFGFRIRNPFDRPLIAPKPPYDKSYGPQ